MKAIIYQATKSSMQSGSAKTAWILESSDRDNYIEPFMRWVGSKNMDQQVKMHFDLREEAINFAKSQDWDYEVMEPQLGKMKPKSYADNFK